MSGLAYSRSLLSARFLLKQNSTKCPLMWQKSQWYLTACWGFGCEALCCVTLYGCGALCCGLGAFGGMFSLSLGIGFWRVAEGRVSSGFLRMFGFGIHTCALGGALGGSVYTPSCRLWELGIEAEVGGGFSLGLRPLVSPILP